MMRIMCLLYGSMRHHLSAQCLMEFDIHFWIGVTFTLSTICTKVKYLKVAVMYLSETQS